MSKTSIPPYSMFERTNQSNTLAIYFDFTFTVEKDGRLSTKLYEKLDDF